MCIQKCNGLMVTSFSKSDIDKDPEEFIPKTVKEYEKYKSRFKSSSISGIKGLDHNLNTSQLLTVSKFKLKFRVPMEK